MLRNMRVRAGAVINSYQTLLLYRPPPDFLTLVWSLWRRHHQGRAGELQGVNGNFIYRNLMGDTRIRRRGGKPVFHMHLCCGGPL